MLDQQPIAQSQVLFPITLDQTRLNIETRSRTSRLPWRGQFSPELIEYLIDIFCVNDYVFFDPFCGSGTVLFEAIQKGKSVFGTEVNPAAWHLASLSTFNTLPPTDKKQVIHELNDGLSQLSLQVGFFRNINVSQFLSERIYAENLHPFLKRAFAASILLGMGNGNDLTFSSISKGIAGVLNLLDEIDNYAGFSECYLSDARQTPLSNESVDVIITSPPYINVFNYHQNYRAAVEVLGWHPLEAAVSEIGANRKHRQNRFLTVVQYCMDMAQSLDEMARVCRQNGKLIMVLGRSSNVLGGTFENSAIIRNIISASGNFEILQTAERVFSNRYGARIFEDILILQKKDNLTTNLADVRQIGIETLTKAQYSVPEKNQSLLHEALYKSNTIQPSPILKLHTPPTFSNRGSL